MKGKWIGARLPKLAQRPVCRQTGKIPYGEREADLVMRRLRTRGDYCSAYRCGTHWHVGHGL